MSRLSIIIRLPEGGTCGYPEHNPKVPLFVRIDRICELSRCSVCTIPNTRVAAHQLEEKADE